MTKLKKDDVKYLVVHESASDKHTDQTIGVIRWWHYARNFDEVGYHFVIDADGGIWLGRPLDVVGAHVVVHGKSYNRQSIGVCLLGKHGLGFPTWKQTEALRAVNKRVTKEYGKLRVVGHCELDNRKTCPGFNPRAVIGD